MKTERRRPGNGLALVFSVAILCLANTAHALVLTNGSLDVDIRADNGAIDTVTFGGADFYNRGTHVSDWGLQIGNDTSTFRFNDTSGITGIPVTTMGTSTEVTVTGTYTAGSANVGITRLYELVTGADALRITTTLQNNNGSAVTLRYFDSFDPDQGDQFGLGFATHNDVLIVGALRIGQARATNDLTVRIAGPASSATVAAGSPFRIDSGFSVNDFFSSPFDGNDALTDQGIHLGYEIALGAGESTVLEYRHAYGTTAAAAAAALCTGTDDDGDGVAGYCDNCLALSNPGQDDADGDGVGDACDTCVGPGSDDSDSDGICSSVDNCPADANPGQEDTCSNSLEGDACDTDSDSDGHFDACDNCPDHVNADQQDTDGNGTGDACNDAEDSDGDEWADGLDICPDDPNPGQENLNGNQYGDACEPQGRTDNAGCYSVHDTVAPPDGNEPTYSFIDIAGSGTQANVFSHSVSPAIAIPFTFEYYGVAYSSLYVSANGFISFLAGQGEGCCGSQSLPQTGIPNAIIAGMWSHIHIPSGAVYYQTLGASPNRQFVIQFQGVSNVSTGTTDTWQIILHEGTNEILVQYANATGSSFEGRGGIENQTGTIGLQWAGPGPSTLVNQAVLYSPTSGLTDDTDSDGVGNCVDNCPADANPGQEDTCPASPGGDACGVDDDGDGVVDLCDNCPAVANPGQEDTCPASPGGDACGTDDDGDGVVDLCDNCLAVANPGQEDTCPASPGGDACGTDGDGDGIVEPCDNCPAVANPGQEDTCPLSTEGDACDADPDGDSIFGPCDNCPAVANAGQEDTDVNGIGDACNDAQDADGDEIEDDNDNCPAVVNPDQDDTDGSGIGDACNDAFDADGDEFEDDNDNCPDDPNPGIGNLGAAALTQLLAGLNSNNATIAALVPSRFDFSEGATGSSIGDGGNDMYDGGNVLNTNLSSFMPYTNGVITASDTRFGVGSSYFTAKYNGLFVMAATDIDITFFRITGNNGADGGGALDGTVLSTNAGGLPYTIYVKRVFNAFDPSINHIIMVPGDGMGVTHSFPTSTDNDLHTVDGLGSSQSIFYILVARQDGLRLADADIINIANAFLSNFGQPDADNDGFGDPCDACVGLGIADGDSDGSCDLEDNCPVDPNPGQEDADNNGTGDLCNDAEDSDGDEWADGLDNCPIIANPTQEDADGNDTGDLCNDAEDGDGDEWADGLDNCPILANPGQEDVDGDGEGDPCDLEHFVAYKARASRTAVGGGSIDNKFPRGWVLTVNDVFLDDSDPDDPENFEVKAAIGLLNPAQKNQLAQPDLGGLGYLRYRIRSGKESVAAAVGGEFPKPPKHVPRIWELQNHFGTINVESSRVSALLLPASADLASSPPPPGEASHFVCYQVKVTKDVTEQTPESRPGSGIGKLRKNLQAFFEDRFDDCIFNKTGTPTFPGTPAAGKCLFDLTKVKELCNPVDKTAVAPPRQTAASITPSTATTTRSLLCYQAKLAGEFTTAGTALLANSSVGNPIQPGQRKHVKRAVKTGNPVHTAPGNLFPNPVLIDTSKYEMVCLPTDVTNVAPVTP